MSKQHKWVDITGDIEIEMMYGCGVTWIKSEASGFFKPDGKCERDGYRWKMDRDCYLHVEELVKAKPPKHVQVLVRDDDGKTLHETSISYESAKGLGLTGDTGRWIDTDA